MTGRCRVADAEPVLRVPDERQPRGREPDEVGRVLPPRPVAPPDDVLRPLPHAEEPDVERVVVLAIGGVQVEFEVGEVAVMVEHGHGAVLHAGLEVREEDVLVVLGRRDDGRVQGCRREREPAPDVLRVGAVRRDAEDVHVAAPAVVAHRQRLVPRPQPLERQDAGAGFAVDLGQAGAENHAAPQLELAALGVDVAEVLHAPRPNGHYAGVAVQSLAEGQPDLTHQGASRP